MAMSSIPKLLDTKSIDKPDFDVAFAEHYSDLLQMTAHKSPDEASKIIVQRANFNTDTYENVMQGLLYGILASPVQQSAMLMEVARSANKDGYKALITSFRRLILEKWTKFMPEAQDRTVWLMKELIGEADAIEEALTPLLRQVAIGNILPPNVKLASGLCELFHSALLWVLDQQGLVPIIVYTFLSIINDHIRPEFHALRDREVSLCVSLISQRFDHVRVIGRDLVRLLQQLSAIPEIEQVFRTVLGAPVQSPSEQLVREIVGGGAPAQISNLRLLLHTKTPRIYFENRLTKEMEDLLMWMMNNVKMTRAGRYQKWFAAKFLSQPESETLIPELIRFICGYFHPTNALLASDIIPRWAVIGWLLYHARSPHVIANMRLALFYDWIFFNPSKDSIMNIEPGMLVMLHSMPKYVEITAGLLDFLVQISESYIAPGAAAGAALKADTRRGVQQAFGTVISKGVVHPMQFRDVILNSPLLDQRLRDAVGKITSPFIGVSPVQTPAPTPAPTAPPAVKAEVTPPAPQPAQPPQPQPVPVPVQTPPAPAAAPPKVPSIPSVKPPKSAPTPSVAPAPAPAPAPAAPVLPKKPSTSAPSSAGNAMEEDDDVLMNWTSAVSSVASTTGSESKESSSSGSSSAPAKRKKGVEDLSAEEPAAKKIKKEEDVPLVAVPSPLQSLAASTELRNVKTFKPIVDELVAAITGPNASPAAQQTAVLHLVTSGLFGDKSVDSATRTEVCKMIIELLSEELSTYDVKKWLMSPESLPAAKVPRTPVLYMIFEHFYSQDKHIVTSVAELTRALRDIEPSIGWRLLSFCVHRKKLITVQLFRSANPKSVKGLGSSGSIPANSSESASSGAITVGSAAAFDDDTVQRESEWFQSQMTKISRMDNADEKGDEIFRPYEKLIKLAVPSVAQRPAFLITDARVCAEATVPIFLELVPCLLRFLSDYAAEEVEFIKLLCASVIPSQLTLLCQRVSTGEMPLIGNCLGRVIRDSLDWPTTAQYCLWRLIQAEFFDQPATLEKELPSILEFIDPGSHSEALAGIQALLAELKPSKDLVDVLLKLPSRFAYFVAACLVVWNSKTITEANDGSKIPKENRDYIQEFDIPALLKSSITHVLRAATAAKKSNRSFLATRILRHLTLLNLSMNSDSNDALFIPAIKSEIVKMANQYNLEAEFDRLMQLCGESANSASVSTMSAAASAAAKKSAGAAKAKKAKAASSAETTSTASKKRKREDTTESEAEETAEATKLAAPKKTQKKEKEKMKETEKEKEKEKEPPRKKAKKQDDVEHIPSPSASSSSESEDEDEPEEEPEEEEEEKKDKTKPAKKTKAAAKAKSTATAASKKSTSAKASASSKKASTASTTASKKSGTAGDTDDEAESSNEAEDSSNEKEEESSAGSAKSSNSSQKGGAASKKKTAAAKPAIKKAGSGKISKKNSDLDLKM